MTMIRGIRARPLRNHGVLLALMLAIASWPCRSSCFAIAPSFIGIAQHDRAGALGMKGGCTRGRTCGLDAPHRIVSSPARMAARSGMARLSMLGEGGDAGIFAPLEKALQQCVAMQVTNTLYGGNTNPRHKRVGGGAHLKACACGASIMQPLALMRLGQCHGVPHNLSRTIFTRHDAGNATCPMREGKFALSLHLSPTSWAHPSLLFM